MVAAPSCQIASLAQPPGAGLMWTQLSSLSGSMRGRVELVAEGSNLSELPLQESRLQEGETGEVRLYFSRELSQDELNRLQTEILTRGATLTGPITQVSRVVIIPFQKQLGPLAIIALAVAGIVGATLLGWQLLGEGTSVWPWLLAGGVLLIFLATRKRA